MKSPDNVGPRCFICDQIVDGKCECIIHSYTQFSKNSVPNKISSLVGDDFIVVVDDTDVLCENCIKLVNQMDKLDEDLLTVKSILCTYLSKKYNIAQNQIMGHTSESSNNLLDGKIQGTPGDDSFKVELLKCNSCDFQTFEHSDFQKHVCECLSSLVSDSIFPLVPTANDRTNNTDHFAYFCALCDQRFFTFEANKTHLIKLHDLVSEDCEEQIGQIVYRLCLSCKEGSVNWNGELSPSRNSDCTFDKTSTMDHHQKGSFDSDNRLLRYVCEMCDKIEGSEEGTEKHLEHIFEPVSFSVCHICGEQALDEETLQEHIGRHELESSGENVKNKYLDSADTCIEIAQEESALICQYCFDEYPSIKILKDHIDQVHSSNDLLSLEKGGEQQRLCGVSYSPIKEIHLVSDNTEWPYIKSFETKDSCDSKNCISDNTIVCDKTDSKMSDDNKIIKSFTIESSFRCTKCHKKFQSRLKLKEHEILHVAKIESLQCEYCLETLPNKSDLVVHIRTSHANIRKTRICPLCNQKCATRFALKKHIVRSHLVERMQKTMREKYSAGIDLMDKVVSPVALNLDSNVDNEESKIISILCNDNLKMQPVYFTCSFCDFRVSDVKSIRDHIGEHEQRKLECSSCDEKFSQFDDLVAHTKLVHDNNVVNSRCPHCLKDCGEHLSDHLKQSHNNMYIKLTCSKCGLFFTDMTHLETHAEKCKIEDVPEHLSEKESELFNASCLFCPVKLCDTAHLRAHVEDTHPEKTDCYCLHCDKYFFQPCLKHNSDGHSSDKKCHICGKQFSVLRKYLFHKEYFHRKELSCMYCGKEFKDIKKLKVHENLHKRNEGKTFQCDSCVKTFKTASGLRFHKLSHTGNYPFFCEYCGRGFVSTHHLEEHVAKHTGEERFVCDVCGKRFQFYDTYHRHRNLHDNPYPKQCDICKRYFRNASRVAEHKRKVHTGERPYKCPYCAMTFNISSTYKIHLCIHTQKYPHNCITCGRGFTTRIKYANHLATKHGDFSIINDKKPNYRQVFPENYLC